MNRAIAVLVAFIVTALLTVLIAAGPAHAHGGPIKLEVQGDGGQGVNATVTYQEDGHMVTDQVVLNFTAVTPEGRTVGPIRMIASSEGQAFYRSEQPLPIGNWTVTVTATRPSHAQKTVAVTSTALPAEPAVTGSPTSTIVIVVVALAAILILGAVSVLGRRRARRLDLAGR